MLRRLKIFHPSRLALSIVWQWSKGPFREVSDMLLAMFLREGASSARIDAVFHDYRKLSIKNAEREKRGAEMGNEYRSIWPDYGAQ